MGVIGKPIAKLSTLKWPYTTIDLLSLFDKVVVHEVCRIRERIHLTALDVEY